MSELKIVDSIFFSFLFSFLFIFLIFALRVEVNVRSQTVTLYDHYHISVI